LEDLGDLGVEGLRFGDRFWERRGERRGEDGGFAVLDGREVFAADGEDGRGVRRDVSEGFVGIAAVG
jgi:hypothetical protein